MGFKWQIVYDVVVDVVVVDVVVANIGVVVVDVHLDRRKRLSCHEPEPM